MPDLPRGCLLFALPRRLLGGAGPPMLSDRAALPALDHRKMHRDDLPALVRARRAAEGCMTALAATAADMPAVARRDVEERVCDLLAHIYDIGVHLADARAFTAANSTDAIAKEKAEVELALVGASAAEIRPLKATMTRLDGRRSLAQRVEADARTLAVRLQSAGSELEDLHARLSATAEPDALLHELRAYERSARLALEAFATTEAEMDRLTRSD